MFMVYLDTTLIDICTLNTKINVIHSNVDINNDYNSFDIVLVDIYPTLWG